MDSPIDDIPSVLRTSLTNDKEHHDLSKWLKFEADELKNKIKVQNLQNLRELLKELSETSWMFDI